MKSDILRAQGEDGTAYVVIKTTPQFLAPAWKERRPSAWKLAKR